MRTEEEKKHTQKTKKQVTTTITNQTKITGLTFVSLIYRYRLTSSTNIK